MPSPEERICRASCRADGHRENIRFEVSRLWTSYRECRGGRFCRALGWSRFSPSCARLQRRRQRIAAASGGRAGGVRRTAHVRRVHLGCARSFPRSVSAPAWTSPSLPGSPVRRPVLPFLRARPRGRGPPDFDRPGAHKILGVIRRTQRPSSHSTQRPTRMLRPEASRHDQPAGLRSGLRLPAAVTVLRDDPSVRSSAPMWRALDAGSCLLKTAFATSFVSSRPCMLITPAARTVQ